MVVFLHCSCGPDIPVRHHSYLLIQTLSAASATFRTRGTAATWWLTHSTSAHRQSGDNPSADTCASAPLFFAAPAALPLSGESPPCARAVNLFLYTRLLVGEIEDLPRLLVRFIQIRYVLRTLMPRIARVIHA